MLRTLLAVAPYLLAAPVAAAPAIFERDACKVVTQTVYATTTVVAHSGEASSVASLLKQGPRPSSVLSEQYHPQDAKTSAVSVNVVATPQATPAASAGASQPSTAFHAPVSNGSAPAPDHGRSGYANSLYFTNWFVSPLLKLHGVKNGR